MTNITDIKNKTINQTQYPRCQRRTPAHRQQEFAGVRVEFNEKDSELSESGLSVNSDERAIQFQKICENGLSESKVKAISEKTALNFQNINTKDSSRNHNKN